MITSNPQNKTTKKKLAVSTKKNILPNVLPIIMEYWVAKAIIYYPDQVYKASDIYSIFKDFCEELKDIYKVDLEIPGKVTFFEILKRTIKRGYIGNDLAKGREEEVLEQFNDCDPLRSTETALTIRKKSGIYFKNIVVDPERLKSLDIPTLIAKGAKKDLEEKLRVAGIEDIVKELQTDCFST